MTEDAPKADVWKFLEAAKRKHKDGGFVPFQPTTTSANDVFNALKAAAHLGAVTMPGWLSGAGNKPPAREILACENGLLHIPTRELLPHTPEYMGLNALPYDYSPRAPEPTQWLRFLQSLWPDDRAGVDGLLPNARHQIP
jgi:putative DNA primase/helicase